MSVTSYRRMTNTNCIRVSGIRRRLYISDIKYPVMSGLPHHIGIGQSIMFNSRRVSRNAHDVFWRARLAGY